MAAAVSEPVHAALDAALEMQDLLDDLVVQIGTDRMVEKRRMRRGRQAAKGIDGSSGRRHEFAKVLGQLDRLVSDTAELRGDNQLCFDVCRLEYKGVALGVIEGDIHRIADAGNARWLKLIRDDDYVADYHAESLKLMYRGTNAWRLAMCYIYSGGIIDGSVQGQEAAALRVGDENKGLGSFGISSSTERGLARRYARQSVELAEHLPTYAEAEAFMKLAASEQRSVLETYTFSVVTGPSNNLLFSQLLRKGYHLVSAIKPGPDVIIGGDGIERVDPRADKDGILLRCTTFCTKAFEMGRELYDRLRPFAKIPVVAHGYGLDFPLGKRPDRGYGFMSGEYRTQLFKVLKVEYAAPTQPGASWAAFKEQCPDYAHVDLLLASGAAAAPLGGLGMKAAFTHICL